MLNVYLRSSSSKGRSSNWAWHWPQLFCRFLHIANDAKDTAQFRQATVASLSLYLYLLLSLSPSLSLPPFPTPGNWKLVEGNISCCFLPPFFGLHAFLKVDCIRRGRRQLGMQLGIKQRRGAAQEVKNERKTKRETTWKAVCFNFDIRTYKSWSVYYFLLLSSSSCQDMITILKEDYIKRKNCSIYSGILWITDYLLWLFSNLITSSQITCFLSGLLLY